MNFPWHQYLLAVIFIAAGAAHFKWPQIYKKIMPPYIPAHDTLIIISGMLEMVFGLMLVSSDGTTRVAAWGIIVLLILFLPVHIYMLQEKEARMKLPVWVLILRVPLQFGLMYWAWQYV